MQEITLHEAAERAHQMTEIICRLWVMNKITDADISALASLLRVFREVSLDR